jgi:hypothetical protein
MQAAAHGTPKGAAATSQTLNGPWFCTNGLLGCSPRPRQPVLRRWRGCPLTLAAVLLGDADARRLRGIGLNHVAAGGQKANP